MYIYSVTILQVCDVEMEDEMDKIKQPEPYIAITGKAGDENAQ